MNSKTSSSSSAKHHQTNPEDRLPIRDKAGYSSGGMAYTLMGNAIGNLGNVVLNIGMGMNPFLVGLLLALPRAVDALLDPLIGTWSDNFRSRWGRRKPFMVAGAVGAGVFFIVLWWIPTGGERDGEILVFSFLLHGLLPLHVPVRRSLGRDRTLNDGGLSRAHEAHGNLCVH